MSRVRDVDVEEIISLLNARSSTREPPAAAAGQSRKNVMGPGVTSAVAAAAAAAGFARTSASTAVQEFSHAFWSGEEDDDGEEGGGGGRNGRAEEDSDSSYDPASSSAASDSEGAFSDSSCLSVASAPVAGAAAAGGSRQKTKKKRRKTRRSKARKFRGVRSRVMDWVKQTKSSNVRSGDNNADANNSADACGNPTKSRASSRRRSTGKGGFRLSKDCLDLRERRDRSQFLSSRNRRLKPPWRPASSSSAASVTSTGSAPATLFNCRSTTAAAAADAAALARGGGGSRTDVDSDFSGDESAGRWHQERQHSKEKVKRKKLRISQQYRAVVNRLREAVESYRLRNAGLRKSLAAASDVLVLRDDQIAALSRQVQAQRAALAAHGAQQDLHSRKASLESRVERYRQLVSDGRSRIKELTSQLQQASARNAEFQQRLQRSLGLNVWVKQRLEDTEAEAMAAKADVARLQEENEELRTQIQQHQLATRSRRTRAHPEASAQGVRHGIAVSSSHQPSGRPRKQPDANGSRDRDRRRAETQRSGGRQTVVARGRRRSTLLKPTASSAKSQRATAGGTRAHHAATTTTTATSPGHSSRSVVTDQATFSDISNSSSSGTRSSTRVASKAHHRPPVNAQPTARIASKRDLPVPTVGNNAGKMGHGRHQQATLETPDGPSLELEKKSGGTTENGGWSRPQDDTTAHRNAPPPPPPHAGEGAGADGDEDQGQQHYEEEHQEAAESSVGESESRIEEDADNGPNHLWHALSGIHTRADAEDSDDVPQKVDEAGSGGVVEKHPQAPDRKVLAAPKLANATEDARRRFERLQSMYQRVYRTPLN